MSADVTVKTVEPMPTAVVAAATTWAEFPKLWRPMLDKVWAFDVDVFWLLRPL